AQNAPEHPTGQTSPRNDSKPYNFSRGKNRQIWQTRHSRAVIAARSLHLPKASRNFTRRKAIVSLCVVLIAVHAKRRPAPAAAMATAMATAAATMVVVVTAAVAAM